MTLLSAIDERAKGARRFEASLHDKKLAGDDAIAVGMPHNASHAALERMKARRRARGER